MPTAHTHDSHVLGLRPRERVRVRSADEIFSTLDDQGQLDNLPFMPEMLRYSGKVFRVSKPADKTCGHSFTWLRRLENTVHLDDVRCDGSAHGGCQAACLTYWKEAWLERVQPADAPKEPRPEVDPVMTETLLAATTREGASAEAEADLRYRCQVTELSQASTQLRVWHLGQYARDVRNWGLRKVVRGVAIEIFNRLQTLSRRLLPRRLLIRDGHHYPFLAGRLDKAETPTGQLDLQAGDLVRIKSREEILATLDTNNKNRGLSFDSEMLKYCGRTARVRGRVERLLDETTGKMINVRRACIILDGVVCTADYHLFCTRSVFPYWREIWLEKLSEADSLRGADTRGCAVAVSSRD